MSLTKAMQIRSLLHSGLTTREIADQTSTTPAYVRVIRNRKLTIQQVKASRRLFRKYYPILPAAYFAERFGYANGHIVHNLAHRYGIRKEPQDAR
jgi:hypothetical protein